MPVLQQRQVPFRRHGFSRWFRRTQKFIDAGLRLRFSLRTEFVLLAHSQAFEPGERIVTGEQIAFRCRYCGHFAGVLEFFGEGFPIQRAFLRSLELQPLPL